MLKVSLTGSDFQNFAVEVRGHAKDVFRLVQQEMQKKGVAHTFGVLHTYVSDNPAHGRKLYHDVNAYDCEKSQIGYIGKNDTWAKSQNNAREKALRLMWKHKTHGHLTSRESANDEAGEYPGAIIIPGVDHPVLGSNLTFLLSFSGFPPDYDEMFCYLLAEQLGLTTESEIAKIVLNLTTRAMGNWPYMNLRKICA